MILYYAFDREMLNAVGFLEKDKNSQEVIEKMIENELKCLVFIMPLDERVAISPTFRFESEVCRRILMRNREFSDNGIVAEYMREISDKDFWMKKNETYRNAMNISEDYRKAYGEITTYNEISSMWIDRIPKKEITGQVSRDAFMSKIRGQGKKYNIPSETVEEVLRITDATREDTFLWEVEEAMLHKYGVSDDVIRRLGVREAMNQSYIDAFATQGVFVCRSCLGLANIDHIDLTYDMLYIKPVLERLNIFKLIVSLSAEEILYIRGNPDLQTKLEVLREHMLKKETPTDINNAINAEGDIHSLITKIMLQKSGGIMDKTKTIIDYKLLQEGTLRILHLSDLHFTDEKTMKDHYFYLKIDLANSFNISHIDYLVISGDVSNRPEESMYKAALSFVQSLANEFSIHTDHIILALGNHDCDRNISKNSYDGKKRVQDKNMYNNRYGAFSKYFYEPLKGKPYPMNPEDQFEDYIIAEDGLCFLALNSCWKIDHKCTDQSSICMETVKKSKSIWCKSEDFVKIAVWHHPLSGWAPIQDTTFMDTLANSGFKACLHGHIHEAKNELFQYDANHLIKIIGAGTFGAVQEDRGDGIPRQYNMIEFDKGNRTLIVHTRKREKDNGVWQADARWEDKNHNPKSYYVVDCR